MGRSKILSPDGKQCGPPGQCRANLRIEKCRMEGSPSITTLEICCVQYQLVQWYFCEDNAWVFNRQESAQYGIAGPTQRHGGPVCGTLGSHYMHQVYAFSISITSQTCPLSSPKLQIRGETSRQALRVMYICIYKLSGLNKKQTLKDRSFIKEKTTAHDSYWWSYWQHIWGSCEYLAPIYSLRQGSGRTDGMKLAQSDAEKRQSKRS